MTPTPSVDSTREVVSAFLTELAAGDLDGALVHVHPDAAAWVAGTTPLSGTYAGPHFGGALRGTGRGYRRPDFVGRPDLRWAAPVVDGSRAAVEVELTAELPGGARYQNAYHFLFVVEAGQIAVLRIYLDTLSALRVFCSDDLRV